MGAGESVGILRRFSTWLSTTSDGAPKQGNPDLVRLDVAKLEKELNIAAEAKRLGEAGVPASDATSLCGREAQIVQRVERVRQDYVDWAVRRLNMLGRDLTRFNITADINRAREADQEFEREASRVLGEEERELRLVAQTAAARAAELETFKAEHRLVRQANYPDTGGRVWRAGVLLALILVEAAFNASFFAVSSDDGLLGGFFAAVLAATGNVGFAFVMGMYVVPYVIHSKPLKKSLGIVGTGCVVAVIVVIGLGISHYREALVAEAESAVSAAHQAILAAPLGLAPGSSWVLLGISIFFACLALFDGWSFDDRYPGYGAVTRRSEEAAAHYERLLTDIREHLEELKTTCLTELDKVVQRSQAALAGFEGTIRDKRSAAHKLEGALADADNTLHALLKLFRMENQVHRKGLAPPAYFQTRPELEPLTLPSFDTSADEAALDEQRHLAAALLGEAQAIRGRIQTAFNKQFNRLNPLDVHFSAEERA
jgi:hypothetical protein